MGACAYKCCACGVCYSGLLGSAVLVSSNLTNLVLAGAFSISFPRFTAFMVLPFLAAAVATYPVFLVIFRGRDYIPRSIAIEGESTPSCVLTDKWGAIFGSVLLTVTLGVLVGTSILDIPVWQITVPPAAIIFIRDVVYDWRMSGQTPQSQSIEMEQVTVTSQMGTTTGVPPPRLAQNPHGFLGRLTPSYLSSRFPTATTVLKRLPVALVPFALMTFVLVQGLTRKGWVELFANGWAWWASNTGVVGVSAGMGIITCILCNVSRLSRSLCHCLILVLDMWNQYWGNNLRRSSSPSLDRPDGEHDRPETTRCCHLLACNRCQLWRVHVYDMCFFGWVALEGHTEAKGHPRPPMAVLQAEYSVGRHRDGCVLRCNHWGDVCGAQELDFPASFS